MVSTSGSRRRSTTFEALTNPCSSAIIMIFSHTSPTYQARARDHAGSLANFGSLIHSGICITPPDKKSDGGAQSLKAGYGIIPLASRLLFALQQRPSAGRERCTNAPERRCPKANSYVAPEHVPCRRRV